MYVVELCYVYVYIVRTKAYCSATLFGLAPWGVCNIMADVGLLCGYAVTQAGPCMVQCWTHQQVWG